MAQWIPPLFLTIKINAKYQPGLLPRHTFATITLQNGVDIKIVSGMLGHFSAGFTLDTCAHVTTTAQKEAAQTMGNILEQENLSKIEYPADEVSTAG